MQRWQRNFLAVWPSLFTVSFGLMAVIPMLPLYIEERFSIRDPAAVTYWTGLVYGAAPLAAAICGPAWGALGDRVGRRPMVLRAVLAIALTMGLMPLAETPLVLALLRLCQGLFAGYVAPAMALVSADVPHERQGRTLAGLQVGLALGLLLGPALGAELAALGDRRFVFWATSGLALLGGVPVLFTREDRSGFGATPGLGFVGDLWARSRGILRNRVVVGLLALVFLMRFGQHMVEPFVALFVRELGPLAWIEQSVTDPRHAIDRTIALAFTVLAAAQIAVTPIWGRLADRFGPLRCMAVVALCLGVILELTSTVANIGQFFAARCAAACFMAGGMTLAYAALSKRIASTSRTLAFAMVQSCMQFGLALGPMTGSIVAGRAGTDGPDLRVVFNVAGACLLLAGIAMVLLRRLPTARQEVVCTPMPEERP